MPLFNTGTLDIGQLFDRFPHTRGALSVALKPTRALRLLVLTANDMRSLSLSEAHIHRALEVLADSGYPTLDDTMPIPVRVALRYETLSAAPAKLIAELSIENPVNYPRARSSFNTMLSALSYRYEVDPYTLTIERLSHFSITQLENSLRDLGANDAAVGTTLGRVKKSLKDWGVELDSAP